MFQISVPKPTTINLRFISCGWSRIALLGFFMYILPMKTKGVNRLHIVACVKFIRIYMFFITFSKIFLKFALRRGDGIGGGIPRKASGPKLLKKV